MVPSAYDAYFTAAATGAAALIGLLFVAVSVRDDTIFGASATRGGEALAITAFTGLVNAFVISLLALIPRTNIGIAAAIMGAISMYAIIRLQRRLHSAGSLVVLIIMLVAYGAQFGYAIALIDDPHDSGDIGNIAFILFAALVVSLQRAWSLLKGRHLPGQARPSPAAGSGDGGTGTDPAG